MNHRFGLKPLKEITSLSVGLKSRFALTPMKIKQPVITEPEPEGIEFGVIFTGGKKHASPVFPWQLAGFTKDGVSIFEDAGAVYSDEVRGIEGCEDHIYWSTMTPQIKLRKSPGEFASIWEADIDYHLRVAKVSQSADIIMAGALKYPGFDAYMRTVERRSIQDGQLIWRHEEPPYSSGTSAYDIRDVDTDDAGIYIAVSDATTTRRLQKFDLDGNILWSVNLFYATGDITCMRINSDSIFCVRWSGARNKSFFEKRDLTGTLLWSLYTEGYPRITGLHVEDEFFFVSGQIYSEGRAAWQIQKRRVTDGELVWEVVHLPVSGGYTCAGLVVDSKYIYSCGYSSSYVTRLEKRDRDGNLIWETFGSIAGTYLKIGAKWR